MHILLDKLYSSEGRVTYVYLNVESQRLFYQTNENDCYTPRMLVKDMPDHIIEFMIAVERKERGKKYLQKLSEGEDDWGLRDQEMTEIRTVEKFDCIENNFVTLKEVHFTRPQGVSAYRDKFNSWEDNIQFLTRHGIDNNLPMGMIWLEVYGNEYTLPLRYNNEEIKEYLLNKKFNETMINHVVPLVNAPFVPIERVAIDIETRYEVTLKPNAQWAGLPVISIAISNTREGDPDIVFALNEDRRKLGSPCENLEQLLLEEKVEIKRYDKEKDLLTHFFDHMRSQPQILLTYHGDGFDLPYLKNRALHLGIDEREIPIHVSTRKQKTGSSKGFTKGITRWRGKIHLDLIRTFENVSIKNYTFGGKYQQNTLDDVSFGLLGKQKVDIGNMNEASFYELIYYNIIDTQLTLELTTFNNNLLINILVALMRLTNTTLPDANRFGMSTWAHNMIFSYLIQNEILIPNQKQLKKIMLKGKGIKGVVKGAQYKGGQLDIRKGYFFNVLGLDFTGLYPSVCDRYNICFSTLNCSHKKCKKVKVPETGFWICKEERGLMSDLLGIIKDVRAKFFKEKGKTDPSAHALEQTQKVLVNGFLGVFGNLYAKLYCPPVTACVTAYSRNAINRAEEIAADIGMFCVYKHTDSIYVIEPQGRRISDENEQYLHNKVNESLHLNIETDNRFKFMIVHEKANYMGIKEGAKDPSDIVTKGMMGKKRNIPLIIKRTFEKIKKHLIYIEDEESLEKQRQKIIKSVRDTITKIRNCEGDISEYTFKVALGKNPSEYVKTTPPHVKVARRIAGYRREIEGVVGSDDRIVPSGTIIRYVWSRKKIRVEADFMANINNIDVEKYIKVLKSTLTQILENININDLDLQGQTQTTLNTFFG